VPWRGLTETKEGRLVVLAAVGGTLMIALAIGNLLLAGAADSAAADVRASLRHELAAVSDEMLDAYPSTRDSIEDMAVAALADDRGRVLGTVRDDGDAVTVKAQVGWVWQVRCIEAELRGDAVVLTYAHARPC
jgi:hypothetical protein